MLITSIQERECCYKTIVFIIQSISLNSHLTQYFKQKNTTHLPK